MTEPDIPQKFPNVGKVKPGNYAWCSCGKSAKQPLCDGSHQGTDLKPVVVKIEKERTVAWCGCKMTKTPPFCDGAHSRL